VYQCEVTAVDDYREKVFQLIPQLDWLDSTDRNNEPEGDSDESEGQCWFTVILVKHTRIMVLAMGVFWLEMYILC
jgi:hypothetical protein